MPVLALPAAPEQPRWCRANHQWVAAGRSGGSSSSCAAARYRLTGVRWRHTGQHRAHRGLAADSNPEPVGSPVDTGQWRRSASAAASSIMVAVQNRPGFRDLHTCAGGPHVLAGTRPSNSTCASAARISTSGLGPLLGTPQTAILGRIPQMRHLHTAAASSSILDHIPPPYKPLQRELSGVPPPPSTSHPANHATSCGFAGRDLDHHTQRRHPQ